MAPPPKTTGGLPESSLIIAPSKSKAATSKKRRRPAFRPASKTVNTNRKQDAVPKLKKKKSASTSAAIEGEKGAAAPQATAVPREVPLTTEDETKSTPENQDAPGAKKTSVKRTAISKAAAEPVTRKPQAAEDTTSDTPVTSTNESSKGKSTKTAHKTRSASSKPLKAKLPPKASTKKAPVSIPHGKKNLPAASGNKLSASASTIASKKSVTTKAKAKTISPSKPGRKRKSTGLVLAGASRIEAAKKAPPKQPEQLLLESETNKEANKDEGDNNGMPSLQNAKAVSARAITTEVAASAQAGEGQQQYVPPPKEGEAPLGQFCSKFRVKNSKAGDKGGRGQGKKKKDQEAKANNLNSQRASEDDREEEVPAAGPVVQIIDGEIVLQESSMVVERGGAAGLISSNRSNRNEEDEYAVVEEDNEMAVVGASYNSFVSRKSKPQHWTLEETKLFYEALRQVGTDFMLMSEFYPNRNRKQLKKKFQREYSKNANLVELALQNQKPLDLTIFQVNQAEVQEQVKAIKLKEKEDSAKAKEDAAKAKEAEEKRIQEEIDNPPVVDKEDKANDDTVEAPDNEDEMEVVVEDEDDKEEMPQTAAEGVKASGGTPNDTHDRSDEHAEEAEERPEVDEPEVEKSEPRWTDPRNMDNVFGEGEEFDENIVVEEDPMVLEEFQYGNEFDDDAENGDDDMGGGGGTDEGEAHVNNDEPKNDLKGACTSVSDPDESSTEVPVVPEPEVPSPTSAPPKTRKPSEPALSLLLTAKKKKTATKKPKFRSARPTKKKK